MSHPRSRRVLRPTHRDRRMLAFMAEHRMVLETQLVALVGGSSSGIRKRVSDLADAEWVARWCGFDWSRCCRIEPAGLAVIDSALPAPERNDGAYKHDVGLAWLWLAAHRGAFGPVSEVVGERRIRSHDEGSVSPEELYSVRLGGYHDDGRERRHYPDLLLIDPGGRRLALELELTRKKIAVRDEILGGFGADRHLDGVLYVVENNESGRSIARGIHASTARMRLLDRVHVRSVRPILGEADSRSSGPRSGARPGGGRSSGRGAAPPARAAAGR